MNGSIVDVKANADYLNSSWNGAIYNDGRWAWNGSAAPVYVSDINYYYSDLDLVSIDANSWVADRGWGVNYSAFAQPWNGTTMCAATPDDHLSAICTGNVDHGTIYFNGKNDPEYNLSTTLKKATIAHEIGHILGLDHSPAGTLSIMAFHVGSNDFSHVPTTYDITDLNNKY
ncbi:hypothetical protein XYCOK13_39800 [Xylanibacillus composti]|uniref:Peptidase M10 metallopeptidase domain-containing protein n=2 Tax=Xylanibacillus composti TaxID=1572762 RepID=A0A8J4H750_9BACL|nr:hypothetical protein XYCOK13_39800 [Xylanibacillus composti]